MDPSLQVDQARDEVVLGEQLIDRMTTSSTERTTINWSVHEEARENRRNVLDSRVTALHVSCTVSGPRLCPHFPRSCSWRVQMGKAKDAHGQRRLCSVVVGHTLQEVGLGDGTSTGRYVVVMRDVGASADLSNDAVSVGSQTVGV